MSSGGHPADVEHLRLFFAEDQEETALTLARLLLQHLGEADRFIHPDDSLEELLGWGSKPDVAIVTFLTAMEEEEIFPKEVLNEVETFRELVEYVAVRSRLHETGRPSQPNPPQAHNSFTKL